MNTTRLFSVLFFTLVAAAMTAEDVLARTSNWLCSYNNGPNLRTKVVINGSQIRLYWGDGPVTTLNGIEDRRYIDAYGGEWLKMSNNDFFGVWNPKNENRIHCSFD